MGVRNNTSRCLLDVRSFFEIILKTIVIKSKSPYYYHCSFFRFNLVDLAATSLIIMFSLPLLGVVSARCLATCFTSNYNLTVLGSIFFIMAADACGLSKRLALTILKHSSGSLVWIFMDVYIVTTWLAICINSAAATFFMMIVIDELLESLKSEGSLVGQNSPEMKPTAAIETPVAKPEVSVKVNQSETLIDYFDIFFRELCLNMPIV